MTKETKKAEQAARLPGGVEHKQVETKAEDGSVKKVNVPMVGGVPRNPPAKTGARMMSADASGYVVGVDKNGKPEAAKPNEGGS